MSWSVAATGKAPAVCVAIAKQFAGQSKCLEPEEGVRQAAASLIDASLRVQDTSAVVKVSASGHQTTNYQTNASSNYLSILIEPQHGFLE